MTEHHLKIFPYSVRALETDSPSLCFTQQGVEMVGYKDPPKHTQFQKGQSGNPKGRPKRQYEHFDPQSANALAHKESRRLVRIKEGEKIGDIPVIEAVLRAQAKSAISGNAYAQRDIINRYEKAAAEQREENERESRFWREYIDASRYMIAEAEAKGEPAPAIYPHPDDVIVDDEKGIRFIGPLDEEGAARLNSCLKCRDLLFKQHALDERRFGQPAPKDRLDGPGSALSWAMWINSAAPKRFQLPDLEIIDRVIGSLSIPIRDLQKELYNGWRSLGIPRQRGKTFPPLRHAKIRMDFIAETLRALSKQG